MKNTSDIFEYKMSLLLCSHITITLYSESEQVSTKLFYVNSALSKRDEYDAGNNKNKLTD